MPEGTPLIGEIWEMLDGTGRSVRGVVADMTETVATLVSFTGNRFRIAPQRLVGTWQFSQPPPPTALRCNRRGCAQAGILRFQRGISPEWVCPRHLPVGVQASLTTESLGLPQTPQAPQAPTVLCPGCTLEIDPIEDSRVSTSQVTFWQCPACNQRWGYALIPEGALVESWVMEAVGGFITRTQSCGVTIHHIEVCPAALRQLSGSPFYDRAAGTLMGFRITDPLLSSGEVIFHTNGAPVVREEPRGRAGAWGATLAPVLAEALRLDRELSRAERLLANPPEVNVSGLFLPSRVNFLYNFV